MCSLPDQRITVTMDPWNYAAVHTVSKYLHQLAPGWKLGHENTVPWFPCVTLMNSSDGANNQSVPFQTNYTLG